MQDAVADTLYDAQVVYWVANQVRIRGVGVGKDRVHHGQCWDLQLGPPSQGPRMLHVSLHAGPLAAAAFNTLIGFADIASSKAAALKNHHAVFRTAREQPGPLLQIERYPR